MTSKWKKKCRQNREFKESYMCTKHLYNVTYSWCSREHHDYSRGQ